MKNSMILLVTMVLLVFVFAIGQEAEAQEPTGLGFYGIGGGLSFVKPEDIDGTIGFGAHANLGQIIPNLALYPSIDYWKKSEGAEEGGSRGEASFSELAINANARYYFPMEGNMAVFAGGGLGLVFWKSEVDVTVDGFGTFGGSVSDTDVGINFLGGLEMLLGPTVTGFLQALYKVDGADTFKITAGVTVAMGAK